MKQTKIKYDIKMEIPPALGVGFLWILLMVGESIKIFFFKKNFSKVIVINKDDNIVIKNIVISIKYMRFI